MAYDPMAENTMHLRRIATGFFDFTGRSRRSEALVFLAAMMLVTVTVSIFHLIIFGSLTVPYGQYLQFLLWIPAVPIFVRRLHDQDKTGWLGIVVPAVFALKLYGQAQFQTGNSLSPDLGFPLNVAEAVFVIAFWALMLWPGSKGENRFGPDPRLHDILAVR